MNELEKIKGMNIDEMVGALQKPKCYYCAYHINGQCTALGYSKLTRCNNGIKEFLEKEVTNYD